MNPPETLPIRLLTHEFFPTKGGIATFAEEMARAAVAIGRQIEVWAPRGDASGDGDFPFPIRRLQLAGTQNLGCQVRLAREMIARRRELRRSIVYLCDPGPILAMRYLHFFKAFKPGKLIITFHGSEVLNFAANPGSRFVVGQLLRKADRISAPSKFTHGLIVKRFPAARTKTFLTPGALRSGFEGAAPGARAGRDRSKVNILAVGRLHPRKGQALALEALAALPDDLRRRVAFWIVGTGRRRGYEAKLRHHAAAADFETRFFGELDNGELEKLYAQADLFCMTSVNYRRSVEGFGLVYLEAAAHGLPIIAHRIGGVAEAVSHGENGLLAEPGDRAALADAFARLVRDPELRETMGRNGRRWAQRHSWEKSAELLFNRWDIEIDPSPPSTDLEPVEA